MPAPRPLSVAQVLEATAGGTGQYLMDICLGLPRERFRQSAVISLERDPGFALAADRLSEAGVAVEIVPMKREISPLADMRALRSLTDLFRRQHFDVIHCHSSKAGFLGRWAARKARSQAAVVYSPHAFAFQMRVCPRRRWLYVQLERWAGRWTDLLVCTCEGERSLAVENRIVPPERTAVVPNGVDLSRLVVGADGNAFREELGVPAEHRLVGSVGALAPQKGHSYLVEAARIVLEELPDTTFLVAGEGPQREKLTAQAQDAGLGERLQLLGQRDDIPRLLASLDLFVLPSLWEGLPYALLEAMAVGVPVVASDITGVTDLVRPGDTGWLAPPADAAALAATIVRALSQVQASAVMAGRARELVATEHTRERMLSALAEVYEGLVTERTG